LGSEGAGVKVLGADFKCRGKSLPYVGSPTLEAIIRRGTDVAKYMRSATKRHIEYK
jgi:hypothetical protein